MEKTADLGALPLCRRPVRAVYVHLPFCAHRCPYCDFATAPLRREAEARYLSALETEVQLRWPSGCQPSTLFLGGGTPAELTTAGLDQLIRTLAPKVPAAREITLEANPRTLLERKLRRLRDELGVTRVSLGAQSFQPHVLEALGRFHRPDDTRRAVALVRSLGLDLSLDLIFAVPSQSEQDLREDLREVLALEPDHVSVYCLTYEPGTELFERWRARQVTKPGSGRQAHLFRLVRRALRAGGFVHYEISNFARPGHRCRHNLAYWRNHPYLGLGNNASGHVDGVRYRNHRDLEAYVAALEADQDPTAERETLEPERKIRETAYLALRTSAGIRRPPFRRDTGVDAWEHFAPEIAKLREQGLVRVSQDRVRFAGKEGRTEGRYVLARAAPRVLSLVSGSRGAPRRVVEESYSERGAKRWESLSPAFVGAGDDSVPSRPPTSGRPGRGRLMPDAT
jgi:oxygen-independent coproporphyrinogen-3 oxidase